MNLLLARALENRTGEHRVHATRQARSKASWPAEQNDKTLSRIHSSGGSHALQRNLMPVM